jgi:hypothetical protein
VELGLYVPVLREDASQNPRNKFIRKPPASQNRLVAADHLCLTLCDFEGIAQKKG